MSLASSTIATLGALCLLPQGVGLPKTVLVSLIADKSPGAPARHGLEKVKAALASKGVVFEEATTLQSAQGRILLVAGLASAPGPASELAKSLAIAPAAAPESLLIRNAEWKGKPLVLLAGSDNRGLMYSLLETADRIGWAVDAGKPFSEVRDTVESPSVADRGVTLFTMQQAQFEDRLHNEEYWAKYFDNLARARFNTFQVLFAYEMDGYVCPAYPYFVDVPQFPDVRVEGLSHTDQQRNFSDLHRMIRMAHDRGINVTVGLWCHYYRFTPNWQPAAHEQPVKGKVFGLTEANLIPYTQAALGTFLRAYPEVDNIMLLMHNESGLKTEDMKSFWQSIYRVMKESGPQFQYEVRAKGVTDDLIEYGLSLGLKIRVNTKYWAEQVGLPFHPTHVQELNQFERRHGYSDMLKFPRDYELHWTLWTSGTTRMLLWGDPEYVKRFAETTHLGGAHGFDIMEPLATKMAGQPQLTKPFELLAEKYRYYDYEFERYWHFFQVFGRLTYNPNTLPEEWDREFEKRFGKDAAPYVEQGLHRASQILPQITAYALPSLRFPTTRGWVEKQRMEDLPDYARAEPSDIVQFQSLAGAARNLVEGADSAGMAPLSTSKWFAQASADVLKLAAQAEQHAGPQPNKEFQSTMVDLKILANLALYHSRRIPAGLSYALFQQTHDVNALDDAITHEKRAIAAWEAIVEAAGDVYNSNLTMGLSEYELTGHWKDELVKLKSGLAALEKRRLGFQPETRRVVGKYDLGAGPAVEGYTLVTRGTAAMFERNGSNLSTLRVPDGHYEVSVGIEDQKKSHGPMWIELNGVQYSDVFTVPAGQAVHKVMETASVNGKLKVLFDNATSADWYASTLTVTCVDPLIAHVPVRRLAPDSDLELRATVSGVDAVSHVRVVYGDSRRGFTSAGMERVTPITYRIVLPAAKIAGGTSYFLEASDAAGRQAVWPEDGRAHPVAVMVTADEAAPTLRHTPVTSAKAGQPQRIVADVADASGIQWVRLRYRGLSQHQDFQSLTMLPTGNGNEFEATIPGDRIDKHFDFMYFFEVMDKAGNGKIYPDLAKETPYIVVKVGQ